MVVFECLTIVGSLLSLVARGLLVGSDSCCKVDIVMVFDGSVVVCCLRSASFERVVENRFGCRWIRHFVELRSIGIGFEWR